MNWIDGNKEKISNLEFALDYLCGAQSEIYLLFHPKRKRII